MIRFVVRRLRWPLGLRIRPSFGSNSFGSIVVSQEKFLEGRVYCRRNFKMRNSDRYFSRDYLAHCAPGDCGAQIKQCYISNLDTCMRSDFILMSKSSVLTSKMPVGALHTIGYSGMQRIVSISNPETHARSNVALWGSAQ